MGSRRGRRSCGRSACRVGADQSRTIDRRKPMRRTSARVVASYFGLVALLQATPSYADSTRDKQWHVAALRLTEAQRITQGEGIIVAVIDSGINQNHPDLIGNVLPGKDIVTGGS